MHNSKKNNGRNGYNSNSLSPAVGNSPSDGKRDPSSSSSSKSSHDSPPHTYARQDDSDIKQEQEQKPEQDDTVELTGPGRAVIPLPLQTPSTYQALISTLSSLGPIASGSSKTVGQWGKSAYSALASNKRRMSEGGSNLFSFGSSTSSGKASPSSSNAKVAASRRDDATNGAAVSGGGSDSSGARLALDRKNCDAGGGEDDDDDEEEEEEGGSEQMREADAQLAASIHHRPSSADDPVIWSSWDTLPPSSSRPQGARKTRVLVQVFASGRVKIWEASTLAELNEVLNINGRSLSSLSSPLASAQPASPLCARFMPSTPPPLLAVQESGHVLAILLDDNTICLYSVGSHKALKRWACPQGQAIDFQVNDRFLVVATVHPLALHIYNLATLEPAPFSPLLDIAPHPYDLVPVYCLSSSRLLAYSSTELPAYGGSGIIATAGWNDQQQQQHHGGSGHHQQSTGDRHGGQPAFDYGEAARRWGEGMMSGMKAVTDYGYNRYYGNHAQSSSSPGSSGATPPTYNTGRFHSNPNANPNAAAFSRSAPHSLSPYMSRSPDHHHPSRPTSSAFTAGGPASGSGRISSAGQRLSTGPVPSSVVILDLCATNAAFELSQGGGPAPPHIPRARSPVSRPGLANGLAPVAHFRPSKHHSLTLLSINPNGTLILTSSSEGHSFHLFEIRPPTHIGISPIRTAGLAGSGGSNSTGAGNSRSAASTQFSSNPEIKVWHRYRLNRGLTVARTIAAHWSQDSRFVLVSTSRGTVHVYPVNPLGGQPTPSTHLSDAVGNAKHLMPLSVTVNSVARVKAPKLFPAGKVDQVEQSNEQSPNNSHLQIGPPDMLFVPVDALPHTNRAQASRSGKTSGPSNRTVHLALFYPYLHSILQTNIALSSSPKTAPATASLGTRVTSQAVSGLTQMMRNKGSALPTFESEVLLARQEWQLQWPLAAEKGMPEEDVRVDLTSFVSGTKKTSQHQMRLQQTSAHEAEIATFSLAPGVLPRSIYLAQTVNFHVYPPTAAVGKDSKINCSFDLGDYLVPNLRRIKVRQEVSHRFGSQSPADESTELRSAMHTVLDATSLATSEGASHLGLSPNSSSPAFPNGYGKTSNSGRWIPSPSSLSSLPIPIGLSPSTVRQAATKVRKYSANMRSPRLTAVGSAHSLQGSTLSFEDDDAVMAQLPPEMLEDVEEGVYLGRPRASLNRSQAFESPSPAPVPSLSLDTGSSADSHNGSGVSAMKDHGHAKQDSSPHLASSEVDDEGRNEGEWDSFKLDGIDDEDEVKLPVAQAGKTKTPSPMLSHAMLPILAAKSEASTMSKGTTKDSQLAPPPIEPQQEAILGSSAKMASAITDTALPMASEALTVETARPAEAALISFSPGAHLEASESPYSSSPGASSSNEMSASPAATSGAGAAAASAKRKKKGKKGK